MCRTRSRRKQRILGLLLSGVVLLFLFFQGSSLPICAARSLPVSGDGYGQTRGVGAGGAATRSILQQQPSLPPALVPTTSVAVLGTDQIEQNDGSPSTTPSNSSSSSSNQMPLMWAFMIGPVAFLLVIVVFITAVVKLLVRKRKEEAGTAWKKGISDNETEELEKATFAGVPSNTFAELEAACEEFTNVIIDTSPECTVFKGIRVSDGFQIAVTRIRTSPSNWTPKKEIGFRRKVEDLARMNHDNLVNLLAYCTSEKPFERMLVFEYASNGTLYEHLHGSLHGRASDADHLDWAMRMRIIMGAAYGLQYMHHELDPPASHFKFDASHVFLTENYAAKVADFGISTVSVGRKSLGRRKSFKKIVKAIGYTDWDGYRTTPYLESNIRSFGVFLLETITGRAPYTETQGPLIDWAKDYLTDRDMMWYLVDPSIDGYKKEELAAVCEVVRLCIQPKASKQPSMKEVTQMLSKALHMSPEVATSKSSPLLWAELELLASTDNSSEVDPEVALAIANSQVQMQSGSQSSHPIWAELNVLASVVDKLSGDDTRQRETSVPLTFSPGPKLSKVLSCPGSGARGSNNSSNRLWAENASELELLSPPEAGSGEDPEAPLALTVCSSSVVPLKNTSSVTGSQASLSRGFRRAWTETASTELSKLDLLSPRGMSR